LRNRSARSRLAVSSAMQDQVPVPSLARGSKTTRSRKATFSPLSFHRHQIGGQIVDINVAKGPQHIQVRLERVFNCDLGDIAITAKTSIIAMSVRERNNKVINAIQLSFHRFSRRQRYIDPLFGRTGRYTDPPLFASTQY